MDYPPDPLTMAEMTADTAPTPEELLLRCEEEGTNFEDYLEVITMSESKDKAKTETPTVDSKLPLLNDKPKACIGLLHMTTDLHSLLQDEAERLRRSQVNNLWWIATFAGEFGENPTIEDVFNTAPAMAENMDIFIYDRQAMPDGYQDDQGRLPRSAKQYKSIEDNARRLLDNQVAINTLASAGYHADHLTARDLFGELDEKARLRNVQRKAADDNAKIAQRTRMETVANKAGDRYGFKF